MLQDVTAAHPGARRCRLPESEEGEPEIRYVLRARAVFLD